jgi:hypothetical protein
MSGIKSIDQEEISTEEQLIKPIPIKADPILTHYESNEETENEEKGNCNSGKWTIEEVKIANINFFKF